MNPAAHTDFLLLFIVLLPVIFMSLLLPLLGRRRGGILFGVTVPLEFAMDPVARAAVRRYRVRVSGVAVTVLASLILILSYAPADGLPSAIATVAAIPAELIAAFVLWRRGAAAIRPYAASVPLERHADLVPAPVTVPLAFTALALVPLGATAVVLRRHWVEIPARWADHFDLRGTPNGWATRTLAGVFTPLLVGMLLVAIFFGVGMFLSRASGPQISRRRRAVVPLAGMAWLIAGMLSVVGALPLVHLDSAHLVVITLVYLTSLLGTAFWLSWRSGLAPGAQNAEPYDGTPDGQWHGGLVYYNPADAAVLVPKRFGFGWTLNFARSASWIWLGATLLVVAGIVVLTLHR